MKTANSFPANPQNYNRYGYVSDPSKTAVSTGEANVSEKAGDGGEAGGGESLPTVTQIISEQKINGPWISVASYTKSIVKGNSRTIINNDKFGRFESIGKRTPVGTYTFGYNSILLTQGPLSVGINNNNYIMDISIPLQNNAIGGITLSFDKTITNRIMYFGYAAAIVVQPELLLIPVY